METETDSDIDSATLSCDGVLGTTVVLLMVLERSTELLTDRGFATSLKIVDREGLSRVGLMAMVLRDEALLIVAVGLVKPPTGVLFATFEGEVIGLGTGNRDRCAVGGVCTGNDGTGAFNNFFVGVSCFEFVVSIPTALRALDLRIVDAG